MTKEEIRKFLDNTKVYVNGKSKEIQEKLFSFGYKWLATNSTEVSNIERPFLFICSNGYISYTSDITSVKSVSKYELDGENVIPTDYYSGSTSADYVDSIFYDESVEYILNENKR